MIPLIAAATGGSSSISGGSSSSSSSSISIDIFAKLGTQLRVEFTAHSYPELQILSAEPQT